ncbi:MAG: hypothetical protein KAS32_28175 [Candidatus Peribacteraceae bacterium]|nr:hypothetical protein [Candidatus Peribacteraceae bacterium]
MFRQISEEEQKQDEEKLDEWWHTLSSSDKYHIQRYISDIDSKSIKKANAIIDDYHKEKFWENQKAMDKAFEENRRVVEE